MKEIKMKVSMDFSEAAVEQALIDIHHEAKERPLISNLTISVFDMQVAAMMLIDSRNFCPIRSFTVSSAFSSGEWKIEANGYFIKSASWY